MATKASAAADSHTETDIRQLQGLAEQQDEEAFLPLRQEELGPQLPRRVIDLTGLVDDAVNCANQTEWASTTGHKMGGTATSYGVGLRFLRAETVFDKAVAFFGVEYRFWARCGHLRCGFPSRQAPPHLTCARRWNPSGTETHPNSLSPIGTSESNQVARREGAWGSPGRRSGAA